MANEEIKEQENAEAEAETTQAQTENQETSQTETEGAAAQDETAAEEKTSETDEVTALKNKVEQLEKENADLKDQVLRRAADFENYRKRMIQEKQEAFDFANTNLLKDLLDSLDNFDRTVEAAATATDPKSIADGVSMISKSMVSMLENKYNLVSYGAVGDAFDPNIHEAIGMQEGDVPEEQLAAVYLKGYKLKDRIIRHAKVMVIKPKA
ncbi:nucleotide exchange factor GrpE [Treponema sp.]|uniref:nucleotide exchange factor GrpE n=1 Tax=Treponema sp. TaxID=166 RepID=UPI00257CC9B9|nr:nucleotide exchange factor GrpE [Treponema sp.]MBE6355279.1 nucleotide exchange factor GrpE [Treponema sp.]